MKRLTIFVVLSLAMSTLVLAGTTGKIAGLVTDAETREPLPGANITIVGTQMGAATNLKGEYFIINVPPGLYSLKVSYMGYISQTISNVRVSIDRTTEVNFRLELTVLETGKEVVVTAERERIQKDVVFSQTAIVAKEVDIAPTGTDLRATIDMAPSLDRNDDTGNLIIRGSFQDEVGLVVDNFTSQDKRNGTPIFKLSRSAIQEIQILTGGFSAEYGQVRSGLINVVTKEGGDKYYGSIDVRYRPKEIKHVGANIYSRENWWQIGRYTFLDTIRGPEYTNWRGNVVPSWRNEYGENIDANYDGKPDFEGWRARYQSYFVGPNARAKEINGVDKTTLSPEELLQAEEYFLRTWNYERPDAYIELNFGGPVPFLGKKLSFNVDGYYDRQSYPIKVSKNYFLDDIINLKLKYEINPNMILRYRGSYGELQTVAFAFYEAGLDPRNTSSASNYFLRNQARNMFNWGSRTTAYYKWTASNGLRFTHTINAKTFWEGNYQYSRNSYRLRYEMPLRDLNKPVYHTTTDSTPVYCSEAPYGRYESFNPPPNGTYVDPITGKSYVVWNRPPEMPQNFGYQAENQDDSWYESHNLKADLTSQINKFNQLKAGFTLNYEIMHLYMGNSDRFIKEIWGRSGGASSGWKPTSQHGNYSYWEGGAYLQDKIEFEGMIMNMGLRADFYQANSPWFLNMWDYYYGSSAYQFDANGNPVQGTYYSVAYDSLENAPHKKGPLKWATGPRIGISHPITQNAKIFFNYGYFFQRASSRDLLVNDSNPYFPLNRMCNPNLKFRKNINYEFGVEQDIADIFTYRVTGYYKDVYNEIGLVRYQPTSAFYPSRDTDPYDRPENNLYRDIRGVEVELKGAFLRYFQGRGNYNYMLTRSGQYGYDVIYQDPYIDNRLKSPEADQPKPRPIFRLTLMFTSPTAATGASIWKKILADWDISAYYRWEAGEWFRWTRGAWANKFPGKDTNVQWKPYTNGIDLQIYKGFKIAGVNARAYVNIQNLLNSKQLIRQALEAQGTSAGFSFTDYMDYLEIKGKFEPGWYDDLAEEMLMRAGPYYAYFKMPRSIVYGLELYF